MNYGHPDIGLSTMLVLLFDIYALADFSKPERDWRRKRVSSDPSLRSEVEDPGSPRWERDHSPNFSLLCMKVLFTPILIIWPCLFAENASYLDL